MEKGLDAGIRSMQLRREANFCFFALEGMPNSAAFASLLHHNDRQ
jgi:hypothetical protein